MSPVLSWLYSEIGADPDRDFTAGRVILDGEQKPRLEYTLDPYDAKSLVRGAIASAEIHLVNGAKRIHTNQTDVED